MGLDKVFPTYRKAEVFLLPSFPPNMASTIGKAERDCPEGFVARQDTGIAPSCAGMFPYPFARKALHRPFRLGDNRLALKPETLKGNKTMTKETKAPAFNYAVQSAAVKAFLALKDSNKAAREALNLQAGKAELALIYPAIAYGVETFDLQPLAQVVQEAKPSALAKRIIKAIFPSHAFAMVEGDKGKRPAFVIREGLEKVVDKALLQIVTDAAKAKDSINCDDIKKAFPAPDTTKADAMAKLGKALAARMKADGLSKADIAEILKGL